jgi:hypothetical protein
LSSSAFGLPIQLEWAVYTRRQRQKTTLRAMNDNEDAEGGHDRAFTAVGE